MGTAQSKELQMTEKHSPPPLHGVDHHATMHWIDPHSLPESEGTLTKFLYNMHGDADGFLLDGEQQVHFPSHMSLALLKSVKVGEIVKIHGVKPRSSAVLVGRGPEPKKPTLL